MHWQLPYRVLVHLSLSFCLVVLDKLVFSYIIVDLVNILSIYNRAYSSTCIFILAIDFNAHLVLHEHNKYTCHGIINRNGGYLEDVHREN